MRIFEIEYPQMKYLFVKYFYTKLKILFWFIIVNLIAFFAIKVL